MGDIIGSPYEFDRGDKTKDFPLFCKHSRYTDDTVMTIAVADAFLTVQPEMEDEIIRQRVVAKMQMYGRLYPYAGYGGRFRRWLRDRHPQPYNSWGNGSAMRVSAVGWLYNDLETVRRMARLSAEVTHTPLKCFKNEMRLFPKKLHVYRKQKRSFYVSGSLVNKRIRRLLTLFLRSNIFWTTTMC